MNPEEFSGKTADGGGARSPGGSVPHSQAASYPLHAILSALTDQIFVVNRQGRHLFANAAGAAALKCDPGEIIGKTGAELGLPPNLVAMIEESCGHAFASRQTVHEMAILETPAGPVELAFTFSPILPSDGSPPNELVVTIREAAQDQEAVEQLWARVHQLHHIIDAAPTLIAYIDRDERYLFSNTSYAGWFGKRPQDIYGLAVSEVVEPALYDRLREHLQAALRGEYVSYERQWRALDGALRTLHVVYVPEVDALGDVLGFVAVVNDITDRAKIGEALRQSELQYRLLAETIPHIVWMTDPGGVMQYLNHRWTDYTGHHFQDASQAQEVAAFIHPEDLPALDAAWAAAAHTLSPFRTEYRLRGADGQYRWFLVHGSPLVDSKGAITRWFGTSTDIHEQKRANEEQAFMADLIDRLRRHPGDPEELLWQVVNAVGRHLKVARCTYAEIDVARDLVYGYRDYRDGYSVGATGEFPLSRFGPGPLAALMSGETSVNPDVTTSPITPGDYGKVFTQIGIHAYITIPMMKDGVPVSTLSVLSAAPREWTAREIALLEEVAERTWFAVENARLNRAAQDELKERRRAEAEILRLNDELRRRVTQFETLFDVIPIPIGVSFDPECQVINVNKVLSEILAIPVDQNASLTAPLEERPTGYKMLHQGVEIPGEDLPMQNAMRQNNTVRDVEFDIVRADGAVFNLLGYATPFHDGAGRVTGGVGAFVDITERKRAQEQLEASYAREVLLNQIGQAARVSTDPDVVQEKTLETLGQGLGVDRAFLSFVDSAHDVIRTGQDWRAGGIPSIAGEYSLSAHKFVLDEIYRQYSTITINDVRQAGLTPTTAAAFQSAGTKAFISVPFFDDTRLTAFLTVAMSSRERVWTRDEVSIVETAATQVRLAVESARINQREHTIAATLQEALQPSIPQNVYGLDVGSYYKAALQESRIGGDFYDLFAIDEHTHAVVIGDVSGKGLAAAAQVATVRNMLRCVLYGKQSLVEAITDLNETLTTRELLSGFVTLFVGLYDANTGVLTYVSCGHEPALARRAETGVTERLTSPAPPLGVSETAVYQEQTARLHAGDALVLYTDGISEAGPTRQDLLNTRGIIELLNATPSDAGAVAIAQQIIAGVEKHAQGRQRDDICLLVLVARSTTH
ncbi:hypothetical protein CCAX7_008310 [Capsulimonas corticalis]|uniref:Uncharacterized protein n=1 Tax=Capsulimonas corticalis TaxID=2219043 RepID=A0A402CTX8_9BACT|nr:SpoIIE family protein phosphatase [Capsulimonas corticalis]BDI28780.1 hypothetical protein CCAX7_008310 [Capsulimonas corticalis]